MAAQTIPEVDGYETPLKPGLYLSFWGNPNDDVIRGHQPHGDLILIAPVNGHTSRVWLYDIDCEGELSGCIMVRNGENERITDALRVLRDDEMPCGDNVECGYSGKWVKESYN